ncbi:MAG: PEP-CTERM sorting domain-containing protein [Acidobacteriota bacterium]|nr:PEP-CTERM sorting domain-containing protein [Acidobacteriota bacterium]
MRKLCLVAGLFLLLATAGATSAAPVMLTFDEVTTPPSPTPVNGLSVMGVTFGFTVGGMASMDARYGAQGPGNFTFINGRVLEGDAAGLLTLNFSNPTPGLAFGVGLSSFASVMPGFTVELFGASMESLGVFTTNASPQVAGGISEGRFTYSAAPVSRAVINFNESFPPIVPGVHRFALDNLTFEPVPVPEPATILLLGTGLAGVGASVRKHHKAVKNKKVNGRS